MGRVTPTKSRTELPNYGEGDRAGNYHRSPSTKPAKPRPETITKVSPFGTDPTDGSGAASRFVTSSSKIGPAQPREIIMPYATSLPPQQRQGPASSTAIVPAGQRVTRR